MSTTREDIGMVGVGRMGGAIAHRLIDCGVPLTVHDADPARMESFRERGASTAPTLPALAERCRRVCITVVDDAQASDVVDQLLRCAPLPELILLHSTLSPSTPRQLARAADERGVALVDAPVSGGIDRAANGTLLTMLGGTPAAVDAAREVLEVYCDELMHVGGPGSGQVAKITNNVMSIVNTVVVHEALQLAAAHDLPASAALQVASRGSGASNAVTTWGWRSRMVEPGAANVMRPMARKDLQLALTLARAAGIELPLAELADRVLLELDGQ